MKIISETTLRKFKFWGGGINTEYMLLKYADTNKDHDLFERIEAGLTEIFPEGIDETQLNDLFWFEPEEVFELAGIPAYEDGDDEDNEGEDPYEYLYKVFK
jgi:hypothetical protein